MSRKGAPRTNRLEYVFYDPSLDQYIYGNPSTSYGPYANDPLNELHANAKIVWRSDVKQYWLRALGPIANRTEILIMYGIDYWLANRSISDEVLDTKYPTHLRRKALEVEIAEQC